MHDKCHGAHTHCRMRFLNLQLDPEGQPKRNERSCWLLSCSHRYKRSIPCMGLKKLSPSSRSHPKTAGPLTESAFMAVCAGQTKTI